jgi:pimeloyl-ACP methyl ester carboxylesterase
MVYVSRLAAAFLLCSLGWSLTPGHAQRESTATILEQLGGQPCPDSEFTCLEIRVPTDHFAMDVTGRMNVTFAVLPASGERKGMFVTATGGPGTFGVALADTYSSYFVSSLFEHFDIVFFNQRGSGLQCADATLDFYTADFRTDTPERLASLIEAARTFAAECVREMGSPDYLPYLSTRQAVEDLEAFRKVMGDEQFWLYGESYGTQYAQAYAAKYPERLAGLILDGTVDLTLTGAEFYRQQAQAFSDVLEATLNSCSEDELCRSDIGGDALAFYDELAAGLAEALVIFTFPLPLGGTEQREFSLGDLETAAGSSLYAESARMLFQRALAAASRGDLVLLARLLYQQLGADPQTLEAIPDPTYSDALFYAVECLDYGDYTGTPDERANTFLDEGKAVEQALPRFASNFYGDLPCVFWPGTEGPVARPEPLVAEGIPTLVLGATTDPATPVSNGERVYTHLDDGYLITTQGGAHVTFGWGNECPDGIVTSFLVDDILPEARSTTCDGVVVEPYVPLAPEDAAEFADPLEALQSAETEIFLLPEYYYWDAETPTRVGCPYGGALSFRPLELSEEFMLTECAFSAGFAMTGTGMYSQDAESFVLDVIVTGLADGTLVYERNGDSLMTITGEYGGQIFYAGDL